MFNVDFSRYVKIIFSWKQQKIFFSVKQFLNIMALILSLQVRVILVYAFRRVYLLKHVMQHSTNMFKLYQLVYLIFFWNWWWCWCSFCCIFCSIVGVVVSSLITFIRLQLYPHYWRYIVKIGKLIFFCLPNSEKFWS